MLLDIYRIQIDISFIINMAVAEYRSHDVSSNQAMESSDYNNPITQESSMIRAGNLAQLDSTNQFTRAPMKSYLSQEPNRSAYGEPSNSFTYQTPITSRESVKHQQTSDEKFLNWLNINYHWNNNTFNETGKPISNEEMTRLLKKIIFKKGLFVKPALVFYNPREESSIELTDKVQPVNDDNEQTDDEEDSIEEYLNRVNNTLTWSDEGFLCEGEICSQEDINKFIIETERDEGIRIRPEFVEYGDETDNESEVSSDSISIKDFDETNEPAKRQRLEKNATKRESLNNPLSNGELSCSVCCKSYTNQSSLNQHRMAAHPQRVTCDKCGQQFTRRTNLNKHKLKCSY
jgi:hypothetical protein